LSAAIERGSTAEERVASYPCEEFVPGATLAVYRAIDIAAPAPVVYRWLCQLRVAPLLVRPARQPRPAQPPELTPGVDELEVGQRIMTIFHVASFEPLVLKLVCISPGGRLLRVPYRWVMPWFDVFMMRKQFLNLKRLAEKTEAAAQWARCSRAA
jgi:hypothetical protein